MKSPEHYGDTILMDYIISHGIGFSEGNIMKYVARWDKKDGLKDLYKARDYLTALIAYAEMQKQYNPIQMGQEVRDKILTDCTFFPNVYQQTQDLFYGIK